MKSGMLQLLPVLAGLSLLCSPGARAETDLRTTLMPSAVEFVKGASLCGHEDTTNAGIFENYPYCTAPAWKELDSEYGSLVIFTCDLPLKFSDSAELPREVQERLQGPAFRRTLRAEFAVSRNHQAFALEYLNFGLAGIFPKSRSYAQAVAARRSIVDMLKARLEFPAVSTEELMPGKRGYFGTPEIREMLRSELGRVLTDYGRSLKVSLPPESRYWYYSKKNRHFFFIEPGSFAWDPGSADTLSGTAAATLTETDLTPEALAARLQHLGLDPFLQDLTKLLNADAPQLKALAFNKTAARTVRYQGSRSAAGLLRIFKTPAVSKIADSSTAPGSSLATDCNIADRSKTPVIRETSDSRNPGDSSRERSSGLLEFSGPFCLEWDPLTAAAALRFRQPEPLYWQPPLELVKHSYPDAAAPEHTLDQVLGAYPYCTRSRWDASASGKTVTFSCDLSLKLAGELPSALTDKLSGPAFTLKLKAEFKVPACPGVLLPSKLSLSSTNRPRFLPPAEKKEALRRLLSGRELELEPSVLRRNAAYAPVREEFMQRVYEYFTSLKVALPPAADYKQAYYFKSRIHYLKSVDGFAWSSPDAQGNFEGTIGVTLADTSLNSREQFKILQKSGQEVRQEPGLTAGQEAGLHQDPGSSTAEQSSDQAPEPGIPDFHETTSHCRYVCKVRDDFLHNWLRSLATGRNAGRIRCEPLDQAPGQLSFFLECPGPEFLPELRLVSKGEQN